MGKSDKSRQGPHAPSFCRSLARAGIDIAPKAQRAPVQLLPTWTPCIIQGDLIFQLMAMCIM